MTSRRTFIKQCLMGSLALAIPGWTACNSTDLPRKSPPLKPPSRAIIIWYSQTGHTRRIGRLIQQVWTQQGIQVDASDYRDLSADSISNYDLIAIGSPVHYLGVPANLENWVKTLPDLAGTPVASFVTFGGPGDEQHNTACDLLAMMVEKSGSPLGIGMFGNMSTFAPTWSIGNEERILKYKHRPDKTVFDQARQFADESFRHAAEGHRYEIDREFGVGAAMSALPSLAMTKLLITNHHIDQNTCIMCETCIDKCPADAIDLYSGVIDTGECLACMGCINNCPTTAMSMNFMGSSVYGFNKFLKEHQITIQEPEELKRL